MNETGRGGRAVRQGIELSPGTAELQFNLGEACRRRAERRRSHRALSQRESSAELTSAKVNLATGSREGSFGEAKALLLE